MNRSVARRRLPIVAAILTLVTGLAFVGVGVASVASNSGVFGIGVAAMLIGYGVGLGAIAWATARGHRWALGMIVASSLLHALAVGSFLTSQDRTQIILMACVAPFVLATVVTSMLAVVRGVPRDGED